jgi:hypothetical protein
LDVMTTATEPIRALKDSNILPQAPFSGVTTNKADFVPFATAPAKMIRPANQAGEALPFNVSAHAVGQMLMGSCGWSGVG